jgi:hypothetical protein
MAFMKTRDYYIYANFSRQQYMKISVQVQGLCLCSKYSVQYAHRYVCVLKRSDPGIPLNKLSMKRICVFRACGDCQFPDQ